MRTTLLFPLLFSFRDVVKVTYFQRFHEGSNCLLFSTFNFSFSPILQEISFISSHSMQHNTHGGHKTECPYCYTFVWRRLFGYNELCIVLREQYLKKSFSSVLNCLFVYTRQTRKTKTMSSSNFIPSKGHILRRSVA